MKQEGNNIYVKLDINILGKIYIRGVGGKLVWAMEVSSLTQKINIGESRW